MKLPRLLVEVEEIRQSIGQALAQFRCEVICVRIAIQVIHFRQTENVLNECQDAAEVMSMGGNETRVAGDWGIGRNYKQGNAETVDILLAITVASEIAVGPKGRDVIIPTTPVVPCNQDDGIGLVAAMVRVLTDGVHN